METERSHMTDQILDLTLEIIFLLTGENYIAFKLSDGAVTPKFKRTKPLCVVPPPISAIPERNNDQNFLEVTKKLIELLTGEVPIRCQDVAVYLSMEEREYLEGHCDRYKAAMMEEEPHLTSADESGKTNSSEPYSCPFYSQEELCTPHSLQDEDQIKLENANEQCADLRCEGPESSAGIVTDTSMTLPERCPQSIHPQEPQPLPVENLTAADVEDVKAPYVNGDEGYEEEIPPDLGTDGSNVQNPSKERRPPLYSQNSTQEEHNTTNHCQGVMDTDDEEMYIRGGEWCAKKEDPPEISTNGSLMRNPPERCPHPHYYSQYSTLEDLSSSQHCLDVIKVEDSDEEEAYERDPEPSAERKILSEISTDERYVLNQSEVCPATTQAGKTIDSGLSDFPDPLNFQPVFHGGEPSVDPSTHGRRFPGLGHPVPPDRTAPWMDLMAPCYEMKDPGRTLQHVKKSFSCLNCGKSFKHKSKLETHERTHNGHRPYACSVCEKRFTQKAHLDTHIRIHTGEKPFVCLTCGRNFRDRSNLITHQRTHTGQRPYSCLRCGKNFRRKMHQKEHICDHLTHYFT